MPEISVCHSNIFVVGSLRMKIVGGGAARVVGRSETRKYINREG